MNNKLVRNTAYAAGLAATTGFNAGCQTTHYDFDKPVTASESELQSTPFPAPSYLGRPFPKELTLAEVQQATENIEGTVADARAIYANKDFGKGFLAVNPVISITDFVKSAEGNLESKVVLPRNYAGETGQLDHGKVGVVYSNFLEDVFDGKEIETTKLFISEGAFPEKTGTIAVFYAGKNVGTHLDDLQRDSTSITHNTGLRKINPYQGEGNSATVRKENHQIIRDVSVAGLVGLTGGPGLSATSAGLVAAEGFVKSKFNTPTNYSMDQSETLSLYKPEGITAIITNELVNAHRLLDQQYNFQIDTVDIVGAEDGVYVIMTDVPGGKNRVLYGLEKDGALRQTPWELDENGRISATLDYKMNTWITVPLLANVGNLFDSGSSSSGRAGSQGDLGNGGLGGKGSGSSNKGPGSLGGN